MKTACIITLGCKVNKYESNQIAAKYRTEGYNVVDRFVPDADVYVVNTCKVTGNAEKKSRNAVSRAKRAGGEVIVCGCAGDRKLNDTTSAMAVQSTKRAFIKVQDGCNNFCTYCIIPYLRGRSRSREIGDVIKEVRLNNKPVVISGIDLSSYGLDLGTNLGELCIELDKVGLPFELSSIEVGIINDVFMTILRSCGNFIPKFHIPLQSGSDAVLKHMNRRYTGAEYLKAVELVREYFPNAKISTDVIIGYPTETPEDLAMTNKIIDHVGFVKVHTFPYSDRGIEKLKRNSLE
ncbi:MAG: radical SAM protein [Firmicutes bacterium]|nr:radical SAM protein [Bacillota bacterium]